MARDSPPRGTHGRTGRWRVRGVMRTDPVTVARWAPATDIAKRMSEQRISAIPVVSGGGTLLGIVSEADLLSSRQGRHQSRPWRRGKSRKRGDTAEELMTAPAITVRSVLSDLLLIDESAVTVSARDGTVTLQGQVADEDAHHAAIRVAGDVDGVAHVTDKLTTPALDRQPSGPA